MVQTAERKLRTRGHRVKNTGIGRRELFGIAAAGGVLASRPSNACSIIFAPLLTETVAGFVARVSARDFEGARRLLSDTFTFKPSLGANPMGADEFIERLRKRPKDDARGIQVQLIDESPSQIVQREFIGFQEPPPEWLGDCGHISDTYIAVYNVETSIPSPKISLAPPQVKNSPPPESARPPDLARASAILSIRYIPMPFSEEY
jgi:hypothetical protein